MQEYKKTIINIKAKKILKSKVDLIKIENILVLIIKTIFCDKFRINFYKNISPQYNDPKSISQKREYGGTPFKTDMEYSDYLNHYIPEHQENKLIQAIVHNQHITNTV